MSRVRLLLPGPVDVGDLEANRVETLAALADLYAYPDPVPVTGWVRAGMVTTVDGAATGPDGLSGSIGGEVDRAVLITLRGVADVVLVGAGTVRTEGYRLPTAHPEFVDLRARRGQSPTPLLAIVSRRGEPGPGSSAQYEALLSEPGRAVLVITQQGDVTALRSRWGSDAVLVAGQRDVDLHAAVAALATRGYPRVLLEGGPQLLGAALAQGRIDEICQTVSPLAVAGTASRIAHGPDVRAELRLAHLIESGSTLLGRWLVPAGDELDRALIGTT